jgi:hypothetical protein
MNEEATPETGPDSAPGVRYFASCRYPHLNITIIPAEDKTPTTRAVKGVYATFLSAAKPNHLQGNGKREKGRDDGTDMNDSGKWGIYGPIMDPGIVPDGGYKDDDAKIPRNLRLTAVKKEQNRLIIDRIRETGLYRRTQQKNEVDTNSVLVELTWDPAPHSGSIVGVVTRGRPSIGKDGVNDAAANAPAETRSAPPSAKVPSLGRPKAAV